MDSSNPGTTGFSQSPALGTAEFTREDYTRAREKYRPNKVRILLVAESPPSSGGYFYFQKTIGKDHLFRETMKALNLWPLALPLQKGLDKRPLLEEFRSKGFFLIDTCELPVDKLSTGQRKETIARDASGLARRAQKLNPEHVIVVKKTVYHPVRDALEHVGFGHRILNNKPLSFPSHGNQKKFRTALRHLLRKRQRTS